MTDTAHSTVTWTPPATSVWHTGQVIHGKPYPVRHSAPDCGPSARAYRGVMADGQHEAQIAVHESAHAVAALASGAYVHYSKISSMDALWDAVSESADGAVPGGDTQACNLANALDFIVLMGAGERAEDRWLREQGLWTPARAVGVELGAYGDRRQVRSLNPHLGFEGGPNDYLVVHEFADRFVSEHWSAITTVARALAERLHLTGDEISRMTGLPNGTHSRTCTY